MAHDNIATLVQKYMDAESTGTEEALLKTTLLQDDTPEDLMDLKALFGYFEMQRNHTIVPDFQNPAIAVTRRKGKIIGLPWIAAAASVVIIVFAYVLMNNNSAANSMDTFTDPEVAAQRATQALELLSGELNRGRTLALDQMKELDNLNKYLNIF